MTDHEKAIKRVIDQIFEAVDKDIMSVLHPEEPDGRTLLDMWKTPAELVDDFVAEISEEWRTNR